MLFGRQVVDRFVAGLREPPPHPLAGVWIGAVEQGPRRLGRAHCDLTQL